MEAAREMVDITVIHKILDSEWQERSAIDLLRLIGMLARQPS